MAVSMLGYCHVAPSAIQPNASMIISGSDERLPRWKVDALNFLSVFHAPFEDRLTQVKERSAPRKMISALRVRGGAPRHTGRK
jgi:hypothetical protein